jgi:hydroxylamine dehydrogenase
MKRSLVMLSCIFLFAAFALAPVSYAEDDSCVACHQKLTPGQVKDWKISKHSAMNITCSTCHGKKHNSTQDVNLVQMPDEKVCGQCHAKQFTEFGKGKHNFGWVSMNALPITHVEPDELMEGGRGCGGCHNMGIKTEAQKKEQSDKGYRYQMNSCDECHTRHTFSKKEASDPRACQQCHMGYDHPQWEMWSSAKHGSRWFARDSKNLPAEASAPKCQDCHMADGSHENRTAWGFLGVRLPLPADPQWAADRVTILKALGVLNPETGQPTARLDAVKSVDMVRLTEEAWKTERDKMIKVCSNCHSERYAREQLNMGDTIMMKTDRLLAEAIEIVAGLYKDGIIKKPEKYSFAYPDFLYFMQTGGGDTKKLSYIDQVLFQMYMQHRMRAYQAFFHVNPDYAYWYGWAMMVKDLGEIRELAATMRASHTK